MTNNRLSTQVIIFLASGAYTGFSPLASGTVGTLVGVAIYFFLPRHNPALYLLIILLSFLAGCWISHKAELIFEQKDSGRIVIDEIVGFFLVMFAIPAKWEWLLGGFLLFRFFDIVKPTPAHQCENLPGGLGVMADDLVAGLYTNLILQLIHLVHC